MNIEPNHDVAQWAGSPEIRGYEITSLLGTGGFSTVYRATQHSLQRDVALKVMNPLLTTDTDLLARFLREARDTASVSDHPNIVTIYEVDQSGPHKFIAMQLLEAMNLKQRIDQSNTPDKPELLLYQLSAALSYIHQRGFIHRDIKPANVLFNSVGDAVLSDFGIAKITGRHTRLTQLGLAVGTAKYMSPEQSQGGAALDSKSDLYSLGVVAFEMLAGHAPFESHDPLQLMLKHQNEPVPALPSVHSRFQPIVNKLLAKNPDQRYNSATDLMNELQNLNPHLVANVNTCPKPSTNLPADSIAPDNSPAAGLILAASYALLATLTASLLFLQTRLDANLADDALRCPELTDKQTRERDILLELAHLHEAVGRLTHPPGANALDAYSMALEIDPCHAQIPIAVRKIREQSG